MLNAKAILTINYKDRSENTSSYMYVETGVFMAKLAIKDKRVSSTLLVLLPDRASTPAVNDNYVS